MRRSTARALAPRKQTGVSGTYLYYPVSPAQLITPVWMWGLLLKLKPERPSSWPETHTHDRRQTRDWGAGRVKIQTQRRLNADRLFNIHMAEIWRVKRTQLILAAKVYGEQWPSPRPLLTPQWLSPLYQSFHTITHSFCVCESTETKVNAEEKCFRQSRGKQKPVSAMENK